MKRNCSPVSNLERFSSTHVKKTIENHNFQRKILKCPNKDELAFPEFEDVPNSQAILYSFSSSFLDTTTTTTTTTTTKRKRKVTDEKTHIFES